jgi:hypothetical protein
MNDNLSGHFQSRRDRFRSITPPDLLARTDALQRKIDTGWYLIGAWILLWLCGVIGVASVVIHYVIKYW